MARSTTGVGTLSACTDLRSDLKFAQLSADKETRTMNNIQNIVHDFGLACDSAHRVAELPPVSDLSPLGHSHHHLRVALILYRQARSIAITFRSSGSVQSAILYERLAEQVYGELKPELKW